MGKPFAIKYSPADWATPTGGVATAWSSPYGGIHVQAPENMIGPQFTPAALNVFTRNSELRSRPLFRQIMPGPDGNSPVLGCGSFLSINQTWHTFAMTQRGLFQLNTNWPQQIAQGTNPWQFLGGATLSTAPVAWQVYAGVLYYSNSNHLCAWDGAFPTAIADVAFVGSTPSWPFGQDFTGAKFITELDNHIVLGYLIDSQGSAFQNRIMWSNNGFSPVGGTLTAPWTALTAFPLSTRIVDSNGNVQVAIPLVSGTSGATVPIWNKTLNGTTPDGTLVWANAGPNGQFPSNLGTAGATFDPGINVNAGFNNFVDVPDVITGLMTIGRMAHVFRQNGITEMTATGNGIAPFDFNHLWASQHGVGNVYPYSIAQYGNMGIFISSEQIYQITPGGLNPIGGGARDAIMADLAMTIGSPKGSIDRGYTLGYSYLHYRLRIPQPEGTKTWVFTIEDNNWVPWFQSGVWPTGIANEAWV
jgi:hypothetical protein